MELITEHLQGLILFTAALLTLGLLSFRALKRNTDSPGRLVANWAITGAIGYGYVFHLKPMSGAGGQSALFAVMMATVVGALLAVMWVPAILNIITGPIMEWFAGGWFADDSKPYYAFAKGLRKRGKAESALEEIDLQLEKFPDDIEGRLLKAEIQAEDLEEVDGASRLLDEVIAFNEEDKKVVPDALKKLADWCLRIDGSPERAEAALQRLIGLFPESRIAAEAGRLIKRIPDRRRLLQDPASRHVLNPKQRGSRIRVTSAYKASKAESREKSGKTADGGLDKARVKTRED